MKTQVPKDIMNSLQYEVYLKNNVPNTDHPLHYHDFYELYFHVQGRACYIIDSKIYTLEEGDIVLISKHQLHRAAIADMTSTYVRYVVWLTESFLDKVKPLDFDIHSIFTSPNKMDVIRLSVPLRQEMLASLHKLYKEYSVQDEGSIYLVDLYLREILILLYRYSHRKYEVHEVEVKNDMLVQAVKEYIDNNYLQPLTLDDIAHHFFLSKYHLMRQFKKHTGLTILGYCKRKRLMKARDLLLENIPISDVYKLSGFDDYSNFLKAFRSIYKLSPREYVKLLHKNAMMYLPETGEGDDSDKH